MVGSAGAFGSLVTSVLELVSFLSSPNKSSRFKSKSDFFSELGSDEGFKLTLGGSLKSSLIVSISVFESEGILVLDDPISVKLTLIFSILSFGTESDGLNSVDFSELLPPPEILLY